MLKFFTSLPFLYAFTITVMLLYGFLYYRSFVKNRSARRGFPIVFLLISAACFSFLYFNIHAPLSLKTFSNLDHHFIRHDGFSVSGNIELGKTDTVNFKNNPFSRFILSRQDKQVHVSSPYSEEPFYTGSGSSYKLLSAGYIANGHRLSFTTDSCNVQIKVNGENNFDLLVNNDPVAKLTGKRINKGITAWNLFKDDTLFINSPCYINDLLINSLKKVFFLRDDVSGNKPGELKYFLSGRLYQYAGKIFYDEKSINLQDLAFAKPIADKSVITWGIGLEDNNKNQFRVKSNKDNSFELLNRYPVSYPMTEENKNDWTKHSVTKFLVSGNKDLLQMPLVFGEGFMFSVFDRDSSVNFSPVLLSYKKSKANEPLQLQSKFLNGREILPAARDKLFLPAGSSGFSWIFSIQNSFNWNFGKRNLSVSQWQVLLFGTIGIFVLLVFCSSLIRSAYKLSWVWQLLSCISLVLLTTRFFLYWRYKTFPPYEGLDLPSLQQLNSIWNFGIIVIAGMVLALLFGFGFLKHLYIFFRKQAASLLRQSYHPRYKDEALINEERITRRISNTSVVKRRGPVFIYFALWILILLAGAGFAVINRFDPATCRHLSIALTLIYFVFVYISYRQSPLVASAEKSWWSINTTNSFDVIMNNPVKVLLSVSLLCLFAFVDMGFAIVFLNFLLFNEAFLCINYAIAGLSTGSRKNTSLFTLLGFFYLASFAINLIYGPYIFKYLLELPQFLYLSGYIAFAIIISYAIFRLTYRQRMRKRIVTSLSSAVLLFVSAFLFFPKEKILDKAAITKYRIDVMTMPVNKAIEIAYEDGKTYEPVIRAAQNQWFINTFIYEKNNPAVNQTGFHLLPHAPQNKGAKYNAQATDLVASRFLIAEHGKWSVLFYVLLLLIPSTLLASFYKLYPDFTNRINNNYPTISAGFSLLNYLLITALLVILAATGRYIFFGQDLPFGSILSKQSVLFPVILITGIVLLFKKVPLEQYPNHKKLIPGGIVFTGLALLLFLGKPAFNKNREFAVSDLANEMDSHIRLRLQPVMDYFDTSKPTKKLSLARKDILFTDSLKRLLAADYLDETGKYFQKEIELYCKTGFSGHLDQRRMLFLDLYSGKPELAVNDNFFRIEPPPHLQQYWTGNIFSDSSNYNVSLLEAADGKIISKRVSEYSNEQGATLTGELQLLFKRKYGENLYADLCLVNRSGKNMNIKRQNELKTLKQGDTLSLRNPDELRITDADGKEKRLVIQPDAFMKNYYVNGSRFYAYPLGSDFIWAKNFAEAVSSEYTASGQASRNVFISPDAELTDSLSARIARMMNSDTAYKKGAEYGICIADGNGRLIAMNDFIKGIQRPDPNDKAGFNKIIRGENGFISQSMLRKQIGNINLLRMNPGPGSTLKPIVFSSIASQLDLDWDAFAAEGFSQKQQYFGGEKVGEYDFEKNNGRINNVVDYLRYSDNYYHSNLLLLGSYSKQSLQALLAKHFATQSPRPNGSAGRADADFHWPYFSYNGKQYWLNGFENWPGYINGKANFGSDSSFVSIGLFNNYGIYTYHAGKSFDRFSSGYDSSLFLNAYKKSGFLMPEYALFDQKGEGMNHDRPNEVFLSSFRGHVKGSSQVMVPPVKMLDAFGKLASQNRNYSLTLNPYAKENPFNAFYLDKAVSYSNYLSIIREKVFEGMRQALFNGTAARLGSMLKDGSPYYYYAKTGTTGDDELKSKSKLFVIIISSKKITDPDFNFRKNKFYTIYFTSQNGPAKQNEEFQAAVIKYVQQSPAFKKYMEGK
ncbi:MAG: hypothetical protein HZB42_03170 [Sphingobacteriales bacterium]|nr:hypothetical protein [Sphingobacteriales bacterium]